MKHYKFKNKTDKAVGHHRSLLPRLVKGTASQSHTTSMRALPMSMLDKVGFDLGTNVECCSTTCQRYAPLHRQDLASWRKLSHFFCFRTRFGVLFASEQDLASCLLRKRSSIFGAKIGDFASSVLCHPVIQREAISNVVLIIEQSQSLQISTSDSIRAPWCKAFASGRDYIFSR